METGNVFKYSVPFTMIANELVMCENMSPILKTVYSIACCYASSTDSSCYPSYTTIARKAGICRSTAIRAIKELVEAGLMIKETRRTEKDTFTSNTYIINQWNSQADKYFNKTGVKKAQEDVEGACEQPEENAENQANEDVLSEEKVADICTVGGSVSNTPPLNAQKIEGGSVGNTLGVVQEIHHPSVPDTPPFIYEQYSINKNKCNNNQSINQRVKTKEKKQEEANAGLIDENEKLELNEILDNCGLENFTKEIAFMFRSAIERLFYSDKLKVGKSILPKEKIRSYLSLLDEDTLDVVLKIMKNNSEKIQNPTYWLMSTIINEICFSNAELLLTVPAMYQHNSDYYVE